MLFNASEKYTSLCTFRLTNQPQEKKYLPAVCCPVLQVFLVFSDYVHSVTNYNRTAGSVMGRFVFLLLQLADERTRLPGPLSQLLQVQNQIFEVRVAPTWIVFLLVLQICWERLSKCTNTNIMCNFIEILSFRHKHW